MAFDPSQTYSPGATTPGGDFPGSGTNASQDSIYGLTAKLAVVPVQITPGRPIPAGADTYGGGASPGPMPPSGADTYGGGATPGPVQPFGQVTSWEGALALFYQMAPQERAAIEDQLYAAGFYPDAYYSKNPKIRVPGQADSDSFSAWRDAVQEAVRGSTYANGHVSNAKSVQDVINERLSLQQQANVASQGRANPVTLTNPDTLRAHLQNAAQQVLGMKFTPSDEANFTRIYHDQEVAAGQPDAQGNYTQAPDPAAFAQQWLRSRYPVEAEVNDMLNAGNVALNVLASGPGGPSISPPTTNQMP